MPRCLLDLGQADPATSLPSGLDGVICAGGAAPPRAAGRSLLHLRAVRDLDDLPDGSEPWPDGIVVADPGGRPDLERYACRLAVREAERGRPEGSTRIHVRIGTARGWRGVHALADGAPRLAAIVFDERAMRNDLGIEEGVPSPAACSLARAMVVLAARAAGVPPLAVLDGVGVRPSWQAELARAEGFIGAVLRSPAEAEAVAAAFEGGNHPPPGGRFMENTVSGVATK